MLNLQFLFSVFIYLLLGHLLADFVFQPDSLVAWKHRSWKGVFVHSLIVLIVSLLVFWQLLFNDGVLYGLSVLILNAALHFGMDLYKIAEERQCENSHDYVRMFFWDQFFHIGVLVIAALALAILNAYTVFSWGPGYYFMTLLPLASYLVLAILCTYVYEIVKFQFVRQKHGGTILKFNYKAMGIRLVILSVIFGVVLFMGGFQIAKTFT